MKLFIPTIGTRLRLTEDWNFALFQESRNRSIAKNVLKNNDFPRWGVKGKPQLVTVPKGTVLTVDRVYIRQGIGNYDSVTFRILKGDSPDERFHKTRFWAKLEDCNNMEVEIDQPAGFAVQDNAYQERTPYGNL